MDEEHIKGMANQVKGSIKEATGKIMGNAELEVEGQMDKLTGKAQKVEGDVKDTARDATK